MYNGKCNKGGGFGHQWFKETNFIRKQMINRFDLYFVGKGLVLNLKKRIIKAKPKSKLTTPSTSSINALKKFNCIK